MPQSKWYENSHLCLIPGQGSCNMGRGIQPATRNVFLVREQTSQTHSICRKRYRITFRSATNDCKEEWKRGSTMEFRKVEVACLVQDHTNNAGDLKSMHAWHRKSTSVHASICVGLLSNVGKPTSGCKRTWGAVACLGMIGTRAGRKNKWLSCMDA